MTRLRLAALLTVLAATGALAPAAAADTPRPGALYEAGPSGRYLMGGQWLFRLDRDDRGVKQGFQRDTGTGGWTPTTVPGTYNLNDNTTAGFLGTVGWYRKDFRLPSAAKALSWVVRFESVNYRSRIWLNGRPIGTNKGAYLPFELRLPPSLLNRDGVNRIVVRVDNRRHPTDFPPSGLSSVGTPTGGWWNYGGILREVYLRKIDRVDFSTVQVQPDLPCSTCAATVGIRVTVRNFDTRAQLVRVSGTFGDRKVRLGTVAVGAKRFATLATRIRIASPRLWAPGSPNLYRLRLSARIGHGKGRVAQRWLTDTGIRSIKVVGGRLLLNGRP